MQMPMYVNLIDTEQIAIGASVEPVNMLTVDRFDEYRSRNMAYGLAMSDKPLRIMPQRVGLAGGIEHWCSRGF
jgi:hypothetical protein